MMTYHRTCTTININFLKKKGKENKQSIFRFFEAKYTNEFKSIEILSKDERTIRSIPFFREQYFPVPFDVHISPLEIATRNYSNETKMWLLFLLVDKKKKKKEERKKIERRIEYTGEREKMVNLGRKGILGRVLTNGQSALNYTVSAFYFSPQRTLYPRRSRKTPTLPIRPRARRQTRVLADQAFYVQSSGEPFQHPPPTGN